MRRLVPVVLFLALVSSSCGRLAGGGPAEGTQLDARRVGIYEAAIRGMVATEDWYAAISTDTGICEGASRPEGGGGCPDAFTAEEQAAILESLSDLPSARFVSDPDRVVDDIFNGRIEDGVLIRVGPISGEGDRVEVPGSAYCGGLCGHWMTLVVERSGDEWEVTGTTGGIGVA